MVNIKNFGHYTTEMKKSMLDKIFFLDKIDAEVFVDYGCGDGTMINFMSKLFPETTFFGYDENEEMVTSAILHKNSVNVYFTNERPDPKVMSLRRKKSALILSSVLHEIYSYESRDDINDFWKWVDDCQFDYIVIRDMCYVPGKEDKDSFAHKIKQMHNVANIFRFGDKQQIADFENISIKEHSHIPARFQNLENEPDMYHFLLKYRYTDNWEREVNENYFAANRRLTPEGYASYPDGYKEILREHFIPEFIKNSVKEKFDIDLKNPTHVKLIWQRMTKEEMEKR